MALETLNANMFRKSNATPVGGSIAGYVVGFYNGGKFPEIDCLRMVGDDGQSFILNPHGTLKYFKKNNNPLGCYYVFTRGEDKKNTRGQTVAQWVTQIDREKTMPVMAEVAQIANVAPAASADELNF
jgi:hypothetical protein